MVNYINHVILQVYVIKVFYQLVIITNNYIVEIYVLNFNQHILYYVHIYLKSN